MTGAMCGIDDAIRHIREDCEGHIWTELVINRLEHHRRQAQGVKPKLNDGKKLNSYYTCGNCGKRVEITQNFCGGCGYRILWNSCRCLTGLPLADAAEEEQKKAEE